MWGSKYQTPEYQKHTKSGLLSSSVPKVKEKQVIHGANFSQNLNFPNFNLIDSATPIPQTASPVPVSDKWRPFEWRTEAPNRRPLLGIEGIASML